MSFLSHSSGPVGPEGGELPWATRPGNLASTRGII